VVVLEAAIWAWGVAALLGAARPLAVAKVKAVVAGDWPFLADGDLITSARARERNKDLPRFVGVASAAEAPTAVVARSGSGEAAKRADTEEALLVSTSSAPLPEPAAPIDQ
jgi:hypothetical protein